MNKRHRKILSIISDGHQATVNELSENLSVSPATVRQDLSSLEKQGFLRRVHGGAVIDETDDISHRELVDGACHLSHSHHGEFQIIGDRGG